MGQEVRISGVYLRRSDDLPQSRKRHRALSMRRGVDGDDPMAFDAEPGGDPRGPWCKSCREPIGGKPTPVRFTVDEHDLNGDYHAVCARPILSLARVMNMSWGRF